MRAGADATGDQEGGGGLECGDAGCDRKRGNGTSAEVKLRILHFWPQIGIGALTIC